MRNFPDWLTAYVKYASVTEAPRKMHCWAGISAIAGALRRRVWIDMKRFTWYPSFYIVFVAKPGIIAKSTSIDIAMNLLRQVPGIRFGPNAVTWQALVTAFAAASESFELNGEWYPMSPLTLEASELGSLINLQDREMVNLLIELWDGKRRYEKITKMSGNDLIEAPWINLIGATTPHWVEANMPVSAIGGGLTSRCVFLYAEEKEKFVPFVDEAVDGEDPLYQQWLVQDLEHISILAGPYVIEPEAREWTRRWYQDFWEHAADRATNQMLEGYAARKQTHMFKTAMVLAASRKDVLTIELEDIQLANMLLEEIEADMTRVFERIGHSEMAIHAQELIAIVNRVGTIKYSEAYRQVHAYFPDIHDWESIIAGAVRSRQVEIATLNGETILKAIK